mmetsp:Transcript_63558/g.74437  ORF Transcript_63558/g.74437 Transcript_63558/m.74437 type:complete len:346 (+) Transcript_63558:162-1199(+)
MTTSSLSKMIIFMLSLMTPTPETFDKKLPSIEVGSIPRRSVIAAVVALIVTDSLPAFASTTPTAKLECLKDLPPLAKDKVRLFLSRHGETENNRLGLVQGSRIDAELNPIGELQAARLGQALALSNEHPPFFFHSPLKRAKQTALIGAAQYHFVADYYDYKTKKGTIQLLSDLKEIDFGTSVDGKSVESSKLLRDSAYTAWASGDIDTKMSADGESMREILQRASSSLYQLQRAASKNPGRSVVAVSHSSFLKVLLAVCQENNLLELRKTVQLENCCINVLDLPLVRFGSTPSKRIISSSSVLGGPLSRAPSNYSLKIPQSIVVRINEKQHLFGLQQECQVPLPS